MVHKLAPRALALWLLLLFLAMANGAFRETVLIPVLGHGPGLVLSGAMLSGLVLLVAYGGVKWLGARSGKERLIVGLAWLGATVAFELAFGFLRGQKLQDLLAAYTFHGGNLWPVVLIVVAVAPWLAGKLRKLG